MKKNIDLKILFVCMSNTGRSPLAEAVLKSKLQEQQILEGVCVASAGLCLNEYGRGIDARLKRIALSKGYFLDTHRSKGIVSDDFEKYDYILAMDWDNLAMLQRVCPKKYGHKLHLLMRFAQKSVNATLADPDDHGFRGYDVILSGIEDACNGLVEVILDKVSKVA